jgi:protein involved in polysaccharide export with SLBB domain
MLTLLGISLIAAGVASTNPPDISGHWSGEDWGQVVLTQTAAGQYAGTYTETIGKAPGKIELKWSRIERRFNGSWSEAEDRFGDLSVRLVDHDIRGALTTDPKSKINPATPRLADLNWTRTKASPELDLPSEKNKVSLPPYRIEPPDVLQIELLKPVSGARQITGQYLVGPDGTINLRGFGTVNLAGNTVTEARMALEKHLGQFLESPALSVEVAAYNSKVYYVITQGPGLGDSVRRFPITGNETVLDAVSQLNGLSQVSSKKMWIARPDKGNFGHQKIIPIDWDGIVQGARTDTNYQLLPGDRLFIADEKASDDKSPDKLPGTAPLPESSTALQLDGTSAYVDLGRVLDFSKNSAFSVSFWMKSTNNTCRTQQMIVGKGAGFRHHSAPGWTVFLANGGFLYFQLNAASAPLISELQAWELNTQLCDGRWRHVVVTYNGNQDLSGVAFYIDGMAERLGSDSNNLRGGDIRNKVDATIGAAANSNETFYRGALSELHVFDRAITSADAAKLYARGRGNYGAVGISGLVAGYHLDEGRGVTVADFSGHGNNGTLHGGATWISEGKVTGTVVEPGQAVRGSLAKSTSDVLRAKPQISTDQIVVEDLALQMIVAIREKNDKKLQTFASDRIKGWPAALPIFAVELRERYRQNTGNERFDLRASESLVEGDLAAVRCTGPKELKGKCLVLFFIKTNSGWLNCSLRASMDDAPLTEHLANLKKQVRKEVAPNPSRKDGT